MASLCANNQQYDTQPIKKNFFAYRDALKPQNLNREVAREHCISQRFDGLVKQQPQKDFNYSCLKKSSRKKVAKCRFFKK